MKAMICSAYGGIEVLTQQEIAQPLPQANELLIQVHAASVTPSDCSFRKGDPFIVRLMYGLRKPRLAVQGVEFSGVVVGLGQDVRQFKIGDAVCGTSTARFGTQAEYLCLAEDTTVVSKPPMVSHQQAVAACDGATTALTFLRDCAKLRAGQRILINGASGAVGSFAIQLAKLFGAHVTAVCGPDNQAMVKDLGADEVIDYTRTDFTAQGQVWDAIFDAVGKSSFRKCRPALGPQGIYLTTVPSLAIVWQMLTSKLLGGKKAIFTAAGLQQTKANLSYLLDLVATGQLKPFIDRTYRLEELPQAHRYVEQGHKRGNVVIKVV